MATVLDPRPVILLLFIMPVGRLQHMKDICYLPVWTKADVQNFPSFPYPHDLVSISASKNELQKAANEFKQNCKNLDLASTLSRKYNGSVW